MKKMLLKLPPNRVRRNYRGGLLLDRFANLRDQQDGDRPEDWIASTVTAVNPGMPKVVDEGLSHWVSERAQSVLLKNLFEQFPEHYLGARHYKQLGTQLGFLAKLLDSSMRLHVQAHPSSQFAQQHLSSRWGKFETYVILGVRDEQNAYLRLGFQHLASCEEWRRIVYEQDVQAMDACFEKIPVKVGDVWLVPGGLPHAIGEGLLVLEIMEPSDLVVRCEFEREGIAVPPDARFMGRDPDFAMKIFDHNNYTVDDINLKCRVVPRLISERASYTVDSLIDRHQTNCFEVERWDFREQSKVGKDDRIHVGIVEQGSGTVAVKDDTITVEEGSCFLIPSAAEELVATPNASSRLSLLLCRPGLNDYDDHEVMGQHDLPHPNMSKL